MISTKLFEGIALNIPLLATVPDGEVAQIVRKFSPSSCVVNDNSAEHVAHCVEYVMALYEKDFESNKIEPFLREFSRESVAINMLKLFAFNVDLERSIQ